MDELSLDRVNRRKMIKKILAAIALVGVVAVPAYFREKAIQNQELTACDAKKVLKLSNEDLVKAFGRTTDVMVKNPGPNQQVIANARTFSLRRIIKGETICR